MWSLTSSLTGTVGGTLVVRGRRWIVMDLVMMDMSIVITITIVITIIFNDVFMCVFAAVIIIIIVIIVKCIFLGVIAEVAEFAILYKVRD